MLNGFASSGLKYFWRNVQAKFEKRGNREGRATSDWRQIWESMCAKMWEVTSQSCQIQCSWLWFGGCRMARISFYPPNNSKPCIQMWGSGRSCLISLTKTEARKSQTFWHWCSCEPWSRTNWMKSIWDYLHMGKCWMTPYMARFHTTAAFQMLSSWNLDTIWRYFVRNDESYREGDCRARN